MTTMLLLLAALTQLPQPARAEEPAQQSVQAKVITSYVERNSTQLVIESSGPLISGRNVYVGPQAIEVTVGDILSRTETDYYYAATAPGKLDIRQGDAVSFKPLTKLTIEKVLTFNIKEHYRFEQKDKGEITAVQGDRAMIDRGSMHEVRERDLYKIYDSSGHYKGLIELRGIGDFQSQGKLYNPLERWRTDVLTTKPGDRVVFVGQRKLFALGVLGGARTTNATLLTKAEESYAGGLIWNLTFPDGWGLELLFGTFGRDGHDKFTSTFGPPIFGVGPPQFNYEADSDVDANYLLPIWFKKNLFYPSVVSPFVAAGLSFLRATNHYKAAFTDKLSFSNSPTFEETKRVNTVVPVVGLGIEFFPARFFRPRIEVRYFAGPKVTAAGNTYSTESTYISAGFLTTW